METVVELRGYGDIRYKFSNASQDASLESVSDYVTNAAKIWYHVGTRGWLCLRQEVSDSDLEQHLTQQDQSPFDQSTPTHGRTDVDDGIKRHRKLPHKE